MQKLNQYFSPCRRAVVTAALLFFVPQVRALASEGPSLPFDDPTWQALVGLALLVNGFLYFLVWRRRPS